MLYQDVVKELVGLPNVGLVVSLYFVQDCRSYKFPSLFDHIVILKFP